MDSGEPESGWLTFAGSILIIGAIMRFFDALWAFRYHGALPDNLENAIFGRSLATYGWIYIIVAVILFMSGVAVMVRSRNCPVGWHRCRRGRGSQRHLVDALLPGVVGDVCRNRSPGDLRVGRPWRTCDSRSVDLRGAR